MRKIEDIFDNNLEFVENDLYKSSKFDKFQKKKKKVVVKLVLW